MDTHPSAAATEERRDESLAGKRVAFAGRLAGMSRRDAQQLIREHGGVAVDAPAADAQIIVVGEQDFPLAVDSRAIDLDDATRSGIDEGRIEVLSETQLWQRLGLVEGQQNVRQHYTPAMLADLLAVPVAVVKPSVTLTWIVKVPESV